ncbi:MAG: hypothetical protein KDD53_08950 [Bdellovibrionales bacterium]|nr:hypothetical protein [Bdellovibrionales bacterium]
MSDLDSLLSLGAQVLETSPLDSEFVSLVEKYSLTFHEWFAEFTSIKDNKGAQGAIREKLLRLAEQHQNILSVATEAKISTLGDLKQQRERGKAVLAYADQLPSRLRWKTDREG